MEIEQYARTVRESHLWTSGPDARAPEGRKQHMDLRDDDEPEVEPGTALIFDGGASGDLGGVIGTLLDTRLSFSSRVRRMRSLRSRIPAAFCALATSRPTPILRLFLTPFHMVLALVYAR